MDYKTRQVMEDKVVWYEKDGFRISFVDPSPGNTDYQAFLAWVAEGNTAEVVES